VLLKPLPYRDPERLVRVYQENGFERPRFFPGRPQIPSIAVSRTVLWRTSLAWIVMFARTSSMVEVWWRASRAPSGQERIIRIVSLVRRGAECRGARRRRRKSPTVAQPAWR
jgi:hypothetical protein